MKKAIDKIIPDPNQPRKTFDKEAIKDLASSFDSYGVISPLKVRPCGDDQYMIITGERRWKAAKLRGDKEIEISDPTEIDDQQAREMQFIENIQKTDVPDDELGKAFADYCETFGISENELARRIGKSLPFVKERIFLVKKATGNIIASFQKGELKYSEAKEIAHIPDEKRQKEVARPFIRGEVSSRHAAKVVEIARKEPQRQVDDIIGEVVYGIGEKEKEILKKPSKPTTAMDRFYRLEKMANELADMLVELQEFPAFGKAVLGMALQNLRIRIDETLEQMGMQIIEGKVKEE